MTWQQREGTLMAPLSDEIQVQVNPALGKNRPRGLSSVRRVSMPGTSPAAATLNHLSTVITDYTWLSAWGQFHQHSTSSFYACRSQKRKKLLNLTVFLVLLGSARIKAACRMLVKLTPGKAVMVGVFVCIACPSDFNEPSLITLGFLKHLRLEFQQAGCERE